MCYFYASWPSALMTVRNFAGVLVLEWKRVICTQADRQTPRLLNCFKKTSIVVPHFWCGIIVEPQWALEPSSTNTTFCPLPTFPSTSKEVKIDPGEGMWDGPAMQCHPGKPIFPHWQYRDVKCKSQLLSVYCISYKKGANTPQNRFSSRSRIPWSNHCISLRDSPSPRSHGNLAT